MSSLIFKDRSKLSPRYIPTELLHRKIQIDLICDIFEPCTSSPILFPLTIIQILGPTGIGKSSTVIKCATILEKKFSEKFLKFKFVYINLKLHGGNKYTIYKYILETLMPDISCQGMSAEEMIRYVLKYLRVEKKYAIIILDEIDHLIKITKDLGIVYDLTRLNEFEPNESCNIKGIIFIARSKEFYEKLDPAEVSTLGRIPIEFPPYSQEQISDILDARAKEAFYQKTIGTDVIDKISKITVSEPVNGDIRYALDLLLHGGGLAESEFTDRVTIEHVMKIHNRIGNNIDIEEIQNLTNDTAITLLAIIKGLKISRKSSLKLKEIYLQMKELLKEKISDDKINNNIDDLLEHKIIAIKSLKEIKLARIMELEKVEKILEQKIKMNTSVKNGK
ncbi:MAG: hypothetical protein DA328_05040 [Nitrososphaeraceae archaeon]|nr:hypothetical protein [Nitrososphaeraceae archaeon]